MTDTHEYNDRAYRLLQHMLISAVADTRKEKFRGRARKDLQDFHDWPIFQKAMDCGMTFPTPGQARGFLENGMAKKRGRVFVQPSKRGKKTNNPQGKMLPVGHVRKTKNGTVYIKTANPSVWKLIPKKERGTVGRLS